MQSGQEQEKNRVYQAPGLYVALFYGLLVLWTVGTAPFIWRRFEQGVFRGDWLYGVMIGFFYLFTWFWSLGLVSRISLDAEGRIELKSLRRTLVITAKEIRSIEGSKFAGGFGFVRMKIRRESAYLFCHRRDGNLEEIIREIRRLNPLIRTARI
ncbi:MAG: hypothetical protein M1418_08190 [Deltaproteobacteria bacterium]|nr:hypothetical protein [Deltaproteobacteria bacterium]